MKDCEAEGCNRVLTRAKYCSVHRLRFNKYGDPSYRTKVAKGEWKGVTCSAPHCVRDVRTKGLCSIEI